MITAERIAELRELLALVESEQPGAWRTGSIPGRVWAPYVEGRGLSTVLYSGKGDKGHAYMLACAARNALPELLDAAQNLADAVRLLSKLRDWQWHMEVDCSFCRRSACTHTTVVRWQGVVTERIPPSPCADRLRAEELCR